MRANYINNRLVAHFRDELNLGVLPIEKDIWRDLERPDRYRFGWMPPTFLDDDAAVVMFSPDLIDEITAWLSDEHLDNYLMVMEAVVDAYVWRRDLSPDDVDRFVEDALLNQAPEAFRLWQEVDARALDAGIILPS